MLDFTITEKHGNNNPQIVFKAENDTEETIINCPGLDEDGLENLMGDITDFLLSQIDEKTDLIVVQNSGEEDPLGIIVDVYDTVTGNGTKEPDTCTFWFEDYEPEEED